MRNSISVKNRIAVILWFLATGAEYRTIGHLFGIFEIICMCLIAEGSLCEYSEHNYYCHNLLSFHQVHILKMLVSVLKVNSVPRNVSEQFTTDIFTLYHLRNALLIIVFERAGL